MDEKSLKLLEFPRIRELLARYTSFNASRELAGAVSPLRDSGRIRLLLRQSQEARRLIAEEPDFSIGGVGDIRELVRRAALESVLEPTELIEVQHTLASMRQLRAGLARLSGEFPLLWEIIRGVAELPQVEKEIGRCIDLTGEVLDKASPVLADFRQQIREIRAQLKERLEKLIASPRLRNILQEDLITERSGRHVIPIKVESRHRIKGIIHDLSNTGATVFVEPQVTVGLGNALRELEIAEKHEVHRILAALSSEVARHQEEISGSLQLVAEFDLALAKARFARDFRATEPELLDSDSRSAGIYSLRLVEAQHPLLGPRAVPLTVEIGKDFSILVITGPNTGGKTVALKTIGLLSLMAQAGIPIPASPESRLPVFDNIFSDIGDEQSIEQTLSTFSWHIGNIVRIIDGADNRSLVLLDELGTSTDPAEGSALARAILKRFLAQGTLTVATTHQNELKAFAHVTPGLENASLDFDPVTLRPTYRLRVGVPGGSNALATAARLGLSSGIIDEARRLLDESGQELQTLLTHLEEERRRVEGIRRTLEGEQREVAQAASRLKEELEQLERERYRLIQDTRDAVVKEAAELHRTIKQIAAELRKERTQAKIEQARKDLAVVREKLQTETWTPEAGTAKAELEELSIRPGDTVWLKELNLSARVLSISEVAHEAEVQAGQSRFRLSLDSLEKTASGGMELSAPPRVVKPVTSAVSPELDLRGKRAHEIEPLLDGYLNDASLAGLSEVRIIHGLGTGTVRDIVRDFITAHPLVKSFRGGKGDEGGGGVTVVSL